LPDGYCLPEPGSRAAQVAATLARADAQSQQDVMFFSCSDMKADLPLDHFGSLKTPLASLPAPQDRATVLAAFQKVIADGSLNAAVVRSHTDEQASNNVSNAAGKAISITGAPPRFVSADAQGAYLTGTLDISSPTRHVQRSVAGGVTVVKGRMFSYTLYAPFSSGADIPPLLDQAKADIARFIAENGG
jgi:hypothetical protein